MILDKKGRPIHAGDLVRTVHFKDRRWGWQYLYHAVVYNKNEGCLEMVPVEELATGKSRGGRAWLTEHHAKSVEIVQGAGEFPANVFQERKAE